MSKEDSPALRDGKRVMRLLELHHRHTQRQAHLAGKLAAETARQAAQIMDDTEHGTDADGEWPALEAAARLARELAPAIRRSIVSRLPPGLAEAFLESVYSFDSIPTLADRQIQTIIQRANKRQLAIALLGAPDDYFHAVTRNMSTRAARMLREDMEGLLASGELRTRDVQQARTGLSSVIRDVVE